jgi:hypothetical protein
MVVKTMRVQTEARLFERTAVVKGKGREAETQTCYEFKKPFQVKFIPKTSGLEISTQIEVGDLFDFDAEVEPILEVIVGRALEESIMEISRERELGRLRSSQMEFEKIRQAEMIEVQRLEQAEHRKQQERVRRVNQEAARLQVSKIALAKTISVKVAKEALSNVCVDACNILRLKGVFRDPLLVEIEDHIVPVLISSAITQSQVLEGEYERITDLILRPPQQDLDPASLLLYSLRCRLQINNFIASLLRETNHILNPTLD